MKKEAKISLITLSVLSIIVVSFLIAETIATNSGSSNGANLTIWDDTDNNIKRSGWNTYFYANYTNATSGNVISDGNCTTRFQNSTYNYGGWANMTFNSTYNRFQFNRTFNYKGTYNFEVNCSNASSYLINLTDNFTITNAIPSISKEQGADWINFDSNNQNHDTWQCTEDIACYYNFTSNITENDVNDVLSYNYGTENTTLTNFTLNITTGMLLINITHSNYVGSGKKIELKVKDNDPDTLWQAGLLEVNVSAVNDAPAFAGLQNETFNYSYSFERIINVTDEENNTPFVLSISFLNCSVAEWSTRNCSNSTGRELFNSSQYSFNSTSGRLNISFTPLRNDVGSYSINFSVMDNSSLGNKTASQIVNFSVLNINGAPYFMYICNNERDTTEDSEFLCWINATDIDETDSLNFSANYSWFKFNGSTSSIAISCNLSTNYNASALVNFTPTDAEVGNWSINISVRDTGSPQKRNSTTFWFFINNTEDLPTLKEIANQTVYQNKTIYVNATDDDLLVGQKNVKNETLTFSSNISWVSISTFLAPSGVNYTTARIIINYDYVFNNLSLGAGNYTAKINVTDSSGNKAERNFTIQILEDNAPVWNETMSSVIIIYENNNTSLNFSQNVTDADGDSITFSFINDNAFPSFNVSTIGIINFTAKDEDVGYHSVTINASDGKLASAKSFNFTVYNINDAVFLDGSILADNASVSGLQVNAQEDNYTKLYLYVYDDDLKIPSTQRGFYNESLNMTTSIQGPNTTLFTFALAYSTPGNNLSIFEAIFTPRKSDVGSYNITINVTDLSNSSSSMQFNLTINEISHPPSLMTLNNQTSAVNRNLYYRINATDTEDGSSNDTGNTNLTFAYNFTFGANIFNSSVFNSTSGEINITFNSSQGGKYKINISVNDTDGELSSAEFWLFVYDYPSVITPAASYEFRLTENTTSSLNFTLNHSIGDNLTYLFYIYRSNSSALMHNISYFGNGTNLTWRFTPNFTDETYGAVNLTLIVYPTTDNLANRTNLSTIQNWSINISHENSPLNFSGSIGGLDSLISGGSPQEVNLSEYFSDIDALDYNYNQTIGFAYTLLNSSGGTISVSITNWTNGTTPTISFSASSTGTSNYSLTAYEYNISNISQSINNVTSNNFTITLTITTTPEEFTGGGGGGGGGATKTTLLKIILPDPLSAYKKDRIVVPFVLSNEGTIDLNDINLTGIIAKNGTIRKDINVSFDKEYFKTLKAGAKENATLTIITSTEELGLYEITVNASVKNPKYSDWGKLYLTVREANKTEVLESIVFTEEFIAENPECIELNELIKEARKYFDEGDYENALKKSKEAIEACKYSISQASLPRKKETMENKLYLYLSLSFLITIVIGILYYIYKRNKLKKFY